MLDVTEDIRNEFADTISDKKIGLTVNIELIQRNIKELVDLGIVKRIDATKKGQWKVLS